MCVCDFDSAVFFLGSRSDSSLFLVPPISAEPLDLSFTFFRFYSKIQNRHGSGGRIPPIIFFSCWRHRRSLESLGKLPETSVVSFAVGRQGAGIAGFVPPGCGPGSGPSTLPVCVCVCVLQRMGRWGPLACFSTYGSGCTAVGKPLHRRRADFRVKICRLLGFGFPGIFKEQSGSYLGLINSALFRD